MNYETFVGYVENELKQHLSNVNSKTSPTDVEVLVKMLLFRYVRL